MKIRTKQFGLTLIEILIVVVVIALLTVITLGVGKHLNAAVKERKTQAAVNLLAAALEKYYQFYKEFPLIDKANAADKINVDDYLVNEGVYFSLNKTPVAKDIIAKIDSGFVTAKDDSGANMIIKVDGRDYTLFRANDAWKTLMRYTYDKKNDSFPLIESAGPDKIFGDGSGTGDGQDKSYSEDNIKNR